MAWPKSMRLAFHPRMRASISSSGVVIALPLSECGERPSVRIHVDHVSLLVSLFCVGLAPSFLNLELSMCSDQGEDMVFMGPMWRDWAKKDTTDPTLRPGAGTLLREWKLGDAGRDGRASVEADSRVASR